MFAFLGLLKPAVECTQIPMSQRGIVDDDWAAIDARGSL
jgi:hypothetical protein